MSLLCLFWLGLTRLHRNAHTPRNNGKRKITHLVTQSAHYATNQTRDSYFEKPLILKLCEFCGTFNLNF